MTVRGGRSPHVVDTNVIVVANRRGHESYSCANSCGQALLKIRSSGLLVLDTARQILDEYFQNCSPFNRRGVGDAFVKWVHDNQGRSDLIQTITITPLQSDPSNFKEFPPHSGLAKFDPSDRKFVAVANTHPTKPPILQATDSKWLDWKDSLLECGITVKFLCPNEIKEVYNRKSGGET